MRSLGVGRPLFHVEPLPFCSHPDYGSQTVPRGTADSCNRLNFKLPGGGSVRICTKDDSYPDGRVFEGVGVFPQVKVSPTVSDIRQGKDAALERAIKMLK
jgi:C-terminal processing protease CtpA/Prc